MAVTDPARTDAEPRPAAPLTVVIADDHPLIVAGLRRAIEHADDLELAGEARTATELAELVERRRPDLVLMDLHMPGDRGVAAIERIRRRWPRVRTVVLSACADRATIDAALQAGASAYVVKSAHAVDIASVLRRASSAPVDPVTAISGRSASAATWR